MTTEQKLALEEAQELLHRIDAMINAPYWNSERRAKVGECARKATAFLETVKKETNAESLHPDVPTTPNLPGLLG